MASARYILTQLLLVGMTASMVGCAVAGSGSTVTLMEDGKTRMVDAGRFDEQTYLDRGYLKNTDGRGGTLYVYISSTDVKPDYQFMSDDGDAPLANIPGGGITAPVIR